ncbi:hypothetical protein ACT7DJ_15390 [Bacillus cereus]
MKILSIHEALIMETSFYSKIKTLPSTLCGISLTKADQVLITIAVNCCMFVHSNRNQFKQEILQQFYTGESIVYQYAQDLVERLELVFDTTFCQDEEFLFCLLQYIRKISYRYQFIPTITSPTLEWHEQVKQKTCYNFSKSLFCLYIMGKGAPFYLSCQ